jgi:uncharacterized protein YukE
MSSADLIAAQPQTLMDACQHIITATKNLSDAHERTIGLVTSNTEEWTGEGNTSGQAFVEKDNQLKQAIYDLDDYSINLSKKTSQVADNWQETERNATRTMAG